MSEGSSIRVLIIDDEPAIYRSLGEFLEDCDFEVMSAENAEDAFNILKNKPQDVAIVDLRLPSMNGETLILKAHEMQPALRYLIFTGSDEYTLSEELENIGIRPEHIISKPLSNLSLMVEAIQELMHKE